MNNFMKIYPLKFRPNLKPVIWGGNYIKQLKGLSDAPDSIGESWEITGVPGHESVVANGDYAGCDIKSLLSDFGEQIVGGKVFSRFGTAFPVMVKFIDAARDLSIQVHPDDAMARRQCNGMGKTELWYVMHAEDHAKLYSGFSHQTNADEFRRSIETSDVTPHLNLFHPKRGDIFYLPAGRVHSIGAGNFLIEVQQSSDITYRIYDYDRLDKNGCKRELHTDLALGALDFNVYDDYRSHLELERQGVSTIKCCDKFKSDLVRVDGRLTLDVQATGSFRVLSCISGEVELTTSDGIVDRLSICETTLLPYAMESVTLRNVGSQSAELVSVTL